MMRWTGILVASALALVSCGETPSEEPDAGGRPDTVTIAPSDTIGILMGDSNYVFGTIGDAIYTADGNIAILDETACCARVYDPSGEFLFQMGREGTGPGELLHPGGIVLLSSGSAGILDAPTGGLHSFGRDGQFDSLLIEFRGQPVPQWAWGVDGNALVGAYTSTTMEDDAITAHFIIGRWEDSPEPSVVYMENSFPFDPGDMASFLNNTIFSASFAADGEGFVYIAPVSSSQYRVDVMNSAGEPVTSFSRDIPRVEKSAVEIADETAMVTAILRERGVPEYMIDYSPDPYRWMVQPQGLGTDGMGRIWVHSGSADGIIMDVYSREGEHLAVVRIEGVENPDIADFVNVKVQSRGILAYSLQDPGYPRLYVLPMPEL
jgi:hypothetical protein